MNGVKVEVLKGINLSIRKGEFFGIIGFSGAGKSTLARCINRLETPDSGKILISGVDILKLSKTDLRLARRNLGMIFQTFNLFEAKTAYKNISYPLEISGVSKTNIRKRVLDAAELVGLSDKLNAYPGGLSGGEKQRVGIARALVNRPDVLLSDEATSALDPQTTLQILELLKDINRTTGITILMITHELDAIKYSCDRMAVLEDGVIIESGSVDDILGNAHSYTGRLFAKVFFEFKKSVALSDGAGI
ncbi:MAG: ATP-binding cassette domain-containing protein [Clostridiales bacterium]|nr:ATP-binding cassette domain-containing protein [Clostridiales bacterium]